MQITARAIVVRMIGGTIGSMLCATILVAFLSVVQDYYVQANIGGDKYWVFCCLFMGFPLGITLGVLGVDRFCLGLRVDVVALICIPLFCFVIGGIISLLLLTLLGHITIFLVPFLYAAATFLGYSVPSILTLRKP
jgi:hypothetical protein